MSHDSLVFQFDDTCRVADPLIYTSPLPSLRILIQAGIHIPMCAWLHTFYNVAEKQTLVELDVMGKYW